jgi:CRP-like cAMP-binding protein
MGDNEIAQQLSNSELFKDLNIDDIEKILPACNKETFDVGEEIFRQGDQGEQIYVIINGQIRLTRYVQTSSHTGDITVAILGKKRVFGGWSSLFGEDHLLNSTAICNRPTEVITIEGKQIKDIILNNPNLGFHVLQQLTYVLRDRINSAYGAMDRL